MMNLIMWFLLGWVLGASIACEYRFAKIEDNVDLLTDAVNHCVDKVEGVNVVSNEVE